jgi:hypothetical protein
LARCGISTETECSTRYDILEEAVPSTAEGHEVEAVLLAGVMAATAPDLGLGDLSTIIAPVAVAGIMEAGSHGNRIPGWLKCCR